MSAPDDVAGWLDQLGLPEYAPVFAAQAVDRAVLAELSDQDLKDLGIPLGHRKRLLKAIAALRELAKETAGQAEAGTWGAPPREAERRQLTVMFVDLVGSTELSARLDPEDMGAVIRGYQGCCAEVIRRWDGHVAKYMGDGVLAYFGWPQAHEDDAERAVRAGLAITGALRHPSNAGGEPLAARIGIATGPVVVGELIGEGAAQEEAVIGETPNLAARLQAIAAPGTVVIATSTRRLLGGLFELADLGPLRFKGFEEPLAAFRVAGEGRAEGRFEALHGQRLTPLVGREHELAMLLERWAWAKDGEGQVVLIAGEPGIGKSRLIRALRQQLSGESHLALSHFCSPYHTNSALHPIITQLERAANFAPDDAPEARRSKLAALLGQATEQLDDALPLVARLLGIPTDDHDPALNLSPQRQKQRTLEILIEQLAGLARACPVLELYEDVHWVDPSTLELLDLLVERVRSLPVLVVLTYRPEFRPPWSGHAHVTALPLNRLGRRQAAAIVERITGGKALPAEVLDQIVARTDGVPLFVEELTKTVLESGLLADASDHYELPGPLPPLAIPATLHDSLMARLDRLATVKEVAQAGAVIGREFSHDLLAAISPLAAAELDAALDQLVAAELVFRRGSPPDATYSFKHALVQDTAYQSLLKSKRQQVHALIVQVLEQRFPDVMDTKPELLAHHSVEGRLTEKAVAYWYRAGQRAIARSTLAEAAAHLAKGLEMLRALPEGSERDRRELDLQIALGAALIPLKGQASPETGQVYARAHELCQRIGETRQLFPVLYGQWVSHHTRAEFAAARLVAEELLQLGQRQANAGVQVIAHRALGTVAMFMGEFGSAAAQLERTIAIYDPATHGNLAFLYTQDPGLTARAFLPSVLVVLGHAGQTRARHREVLAEARKLAHPNTLAQVLLICCFVRHLLREGPGVVELAEELIPLSAEQGFPYWLGMATILKGWALTRAEEPERGMDLMRQGLTTYRATGAENWVPYFLALLADGYRELDPPAEGLGLLTEALARVRRTRERWCEAELHRLRGKLLLCIPGADEHAAEAAFRESIAVAREQSARLWELRAATSLARLWRDHGKRTEAYGLLAPVYGWFTEGFDTADLKDAKALLDELR